MDSDGTLRLPESLLSNENEEANWPGINSMIAEIFDLDEGEESNNPQPPSRFDCSNDYNRSFVE